MNRAEKAKVIEDLKARVAKASIAISTDFKGMKVEEMTELRKKLRESDVDYQVVKNTLARIAFDGSEHDVMKETFKECCAVAFGYDDPVSAAKILVEYAKKSKSLELRVGSLEGKMLGLEELKALSTLPGKDELLAKTLGTMNAVPTNFVCLFANLIRNTLYALNAIKEQKEQSA